MVVDVIPEFEAPIKELFSLTDGPFEAEAFKAKVWEFAPFDAENSDDDLWQFPLSSDCVLLVPVWLEGDGRAIVSSAILSFCWWESWSRRDHKTEESYIKERTEFDNAFDEARRKTVAAIGTPLLEGKDDDENGHRYAIWQGKQGLLILQQSALDVQFGLDINYWLQSWSGAAPKPTSPFIDWLQDHSSVRMGDPSLA